MLTAQVPMPKNLDAYQADRAGDSIAINPELSRKLDIVACSGPFTPAMISSSMPVGKRVFGDQLSNVASKKRLVPGRGVKHLAPFRQTHSLFHDV